MLPGVGGTELVVIAIVALIVVGPRDLPMLMRKVGQWIGRARGMAAEFRASFDEMARQSELDELRREVEALRRGEPLDPLRDEMRALDEDVRLRLDQGGLSPEHVDAPQTPSPDWRDDQVETPAAPAAAPESSAEAAPERSRSRTRKAAGEAQTAAAEEPTAAARAKKTSTRPRKPRTETPT